MANCDERQSQQQCGDCKINKYPSNQSTNRTAVIGLVLAVMGIVGWSPAFAQEERSFFDTIAEWLKPSSAISGEAQHRGATPSHVFRAVEDLTAEVNILRDELGVFDYPAAAELQEDRAQVHVYAKTLEVLSKVIKIQRRFGVSETTPGRIPFKVVDSGDVLANVEYLTNELRKVKMEMAIDREIEPVALVGGKTPSSVYRSLADVSLLLDGIAGRPLNPNDVYQNCLSIHDEMELIAAKLSVPLDLDFPVVAEAKRPKDVALQVLRATYKIIRLQMRLGMDASGVPSLTMVRVTPNEVFDSTNMLLAELARIKLHLGVDVQRDGRAAPNNKQPNDSFGVILGVIRNLDKMSSAARGQ